MQVGKKDIVVRHLLSHRAGLAAIKKVLPVDAFFDWDRYAMNQAHYEETGGNARWWGILSAMYEAVGCEFTPPSPDE